MWFDLYNFARLAEDIGVGVYATRDTAPQWTAKGLSDAFLRALDGREESSRLKEKAKAIGVLARENPGRYIAAREIVMLAQSGKS